MPNISLTAPTDFSAEAQAIERRRKLAETLQAQSLQPLESQTAGGWVVPTSWTQGAAKLAQALAGNYTAGQAESESKDLATRRSQALAQALGGMPKAQTRDLNPVAMDDDGNMMPPALQTTQPTTQDNAAWLGQLAQIDPQAVQIGTGMLGMQQQTLNREEDRAFRGQQATEQRQARMQELEMRLQDSRLQAQERAALQQQLAQERAQLQRDIAAMHDQTRRELPQIMAQFRPPAAPQPLEAVIGEDGKPTYVTRENAVGRTPASSKDGARALPASALRMQQEELDAIGTASSINADLGAVANQIKDGKLQLGPVNNIVGAGRNMLGMSNESSRNLATFQSTLERLRNESLRLNKGVQTDGDAQRAWNELLQNINDPKVVRQRLEEIQKINERAAGIRRMNVDAIRNNFNAGPLDTSGYSSQSSAIGGGAPSGFRVLGRE